MIINAMHSPIELDKKSIQKLSHRHLGVGFDQLLIFSSSTKADFFCRIFNADGTEAEQCGNGLRCIGRLVHEEQLVKKNHFTLETKAGLFPITVENYEHIQLTLNPPHISHALYSLSTSIGQAPLSIIATGNPHAILKLESIHSLSMQQIGAEISKNPFFPEGTNVGLMEIIRSDHIRLRTYERGVGETFACGSNSCAAVVAGIINGWLKQKVTVELHFGNLSVDWQGPGHPIFLTGNAKRSYTGEIALKDFQ